MPMKNLLFSKSIIFLIALSLFLENGAYSQSNNNYGFSKPVENYSAITTAAVSRTGGTANEGYYDNLSIGFDFWYMGTKHTTFSVSTNGWMVLGQNIGNATNAAPTNNLNTGALRPVLAPLWDDLDIYPGTVAGIGAGDIKHSTTGVEGSRILIVQWRDMRWNSGSSSRMSFQVKLYEATGAVRFSYSRVNNTAPTNSPSASIGISGPNNGQFASVTSIATPAVNYIAETTNISTKPANNTNYQFQSTVAAPTNLTFTAIGPKQVTLNWVDVATDNIGYVVYRSTSPTTGFVQVGGILSANATAYTNTGLTENIKYYYKIFAVRETLSPVLTGNVSTIPCPETYPTGVQVNYAYNSNANDELNLNQGEFQGGLPTPITDRFGNENRAYSLNGTSNYMSTTLPYTSTPTFTISIWFKTTTTEGGKLVSFGNTRVGTSSSHDRHLYMTPNGRIYFGVYPGAVKTVNTITAYNDGNWHQATGVLSAGGLRLFMDGVLISTDATVTTAQIYTGYWRVGYDRMDSSWTDWPSDARTQAYFNGEIDDVIMYSRGLSNAEILQLYQPTFVATNTAPVCAGYTFGLNAPFFVGATYSWSGPNGYTSTLQNPTGIELNANTVGVYTVSASISGGCVTTSPTRVDFKLDPGLWAGKKDTSWINANNWCAGSLPTAAVNVTIPTSGPTFNPTLTTVGLANNITVESNRALSISGNGDLQLAGTITKAATGTITASAGKVTLNGTSTQEIPTNVFANNLIKDLTLNNTAGVTLNGALRLTGLLTPSAGIFQTGGNLTLASSETATASVATIPSNTSVRGNVKVERFLKGGAMNLSRTYRMLSSPVYDNITDFVNTNVEGNRTAKFSQLIDDMIISGANGAAGNFDVTHNNQTSAWTYDAGFTPIPNINTAVNAGKGMYVFFRGNRDDFEAKTNSPFTNPEDVVMDFDGVLNQQDITLTLPKGGSFLGNPYAATIDWSSTNLTKVNLNNAVWIWRPEKRSYATFTNGVGANGGSRYIASGQGFFVQTSAAGSITFKESVKAASQQSPVLLMATPEKSRVVFSDGMTLQNFVTPRSTLRVSMKPLASYGEDETVMVFNEGSSAAFDDEDATHIDGEVVNITTLAGTRKLAINFHAPVTPLLDIPIHVNAASTGSYTLLFNDDEYFADQELVLKDNFLSREIPITANLVYSFSIDKANTQTFGTNRFKIAAARLTVLPINVIYFLASKKHDGVSLNWKTLTQNTLKNFILDRVDSDGNKASISTIEKNDDGVYTFYDSEPKPGLNYYQLKALNLNGISEDFGNIAVYFDLHAPNQTLLYPNPAAENFTIKLDNLKVGKYLVSLYDTNGKKFINLVTTSYELLNGYKVNSSEFASGVYFVEIKDSSTAEVIYVDKLIKR